MPTTAAMAPIDRSMPRTRIGNVCPMARMATNEKPDIRFSTFEAEAKPGAAAQKNAIVTAKNRRSAAVAGRNIMVSASGQGRAAARDAAARSAAEDYQRCDGAIEFTLLLVAMI